MPNLTFLLLYSMIVLDSLPRADLFNWENQHVAQKSKTTSRSSKKSTETSTKVTRITATDTKVKSKAAVSSKISPKKKQADATSSKVVAATPVVKTEKTERKNFFTAIGGYFKGAWEELRQVRWPNRRTTWGLTLAVLVFTGFFVIIIVLLDYGFQWLFERILG